jgi:nucleoside-diphosphate-sugar epimerase
VSNLKVLFIGGTGVISSACAREAVARDVEVFVLNRGQSTARPLPPGVRSCGRMRGDPGSVRDALEGLDFDSVVDFVAFTPDTCGRHRAVRGRTGQYVFISTASAYQTPPSRLPVTESTPLRNPFWQYSRDKIACEDLLVSAYRDDGVPGDDRAAVAHLRREKTVLLDGGWTSLAGCSRASR